MTGLRHAWNGLRLDQLFAKSLFGAQFEVRSRPRALMQNPSLRAGFWMRLASEARGPLRHLARWRLISGFSCDVSGGSRIVGGLYLPHPIGIVIGYGVILEENVTLYQHVTLGAGRDAGYPRVGAGVRVFPNSMIVGGVVIGAGATIGAMNFVDFDVTEGRTLRAPRPQSDSSAER